MNDPATPSPQPAAAAPWRATVLTIFPAMFPGPLGVSLVGQALAAGRWSLEAIDIRDFGLGRRRRVRQAGDEPGAK